jgi:hypothetical protein
MEPISLLFAAYLDSIVNVTHRHVQRSLGAELQAEHIEYDGTVIDFQHQLWQVRYPTVCGSQRGNLQAFSECTVKAQALFSELCQSLAQRRSLDAYGSKTRTMYCNAAVTFRPTLASISAAGETDALADARQRCNTATAAALGSGDSRLVAKREKAYSELTELRAAQGLE